MRLGCLLPLVSIAFIIDGGQSVYTGMKNRKPTDITIDELIRSKPKAEWLNVTGGVLDTMNSAYTSAFGVGDAQSIYVPLVPKDADSSEGTIHLLVLTKDAELVGFTNEARKMEESKADEGAAMEFILKNRANMRVERPVMGLVQFGMTSNDKKTRKIRQLYDNLAEDAIILEEGEKPSTGQGVAMLLAGLGLGGFLVMRAAKSTPAASPGNPPPMPPAAPVG